MRAAPEAREVTTPTGRDWRDAVQMLDAAIRAVEDAFAALGIDRVYVDQDIDSVAEEVERAWEEPGLAAPYADSDGRATDTAETNTAREPGKAQIPGSVLRARQGSNLRPSVP
jgi:hypothetical protein